MATNSQATDTNTTPPANIENPTTDTTNASSTSILSSLHSYPFTNDAAFLAGLAQIFGHAGTPVTEEELETKPDLVLSAKCFYFSRKFQTPTPIDPVAYKTWPAAHNPSASPSKAAPPPAPTAAVPATPTTTTTSQTPSLAQAIETSSPAQEVQPPYPTSFAAIVDLITNNKPIPGIEEIPTTVLEPGSSRQDRATRRRKPWEKDADDADTTTTTLETAAATAGPVSSTTTATTTTATGESGQGQEQTDAVGADDNGGSSPSRTRTDQGEGLLRLLRPDAVPDSGLVAKD